MKRLFTFAAAGLVAAVLLCAGISAFDANDYDYSYDYDSYSYDYDYDSGWDYYVDYDYEDW